MILQVVVVVVVGDLFVYLLYVGLEFFIVVVGELFEDFLVVVSVYVEFLLFVYYYEIVFVGGWVYCVVVQCVDFQ